MPHVSNTLSSLTGLRLCGPLTSQALSCLQASVLAVPSAQHVSAHVEFLPNRWGPARSHLLREAFPDHSV